LAIEIERKFLVHRERLPQLPEGETIIQGYIPALNRITVRVRIRAARAWLTLKGASTGIRRSEFEYEIPLSDARDMLAQLCQAGVVEKTRYEILHAGQRWELDIFAGANAGLLVAELELPEEGSTKTSPSRSPTGWRKKSAPTRATPIRPCCSTPGRGGLRFRDCHAIATRTSSPRHMGTAQCPAIELRR
jgi:adenylate cyclase